MRHSGICLWFCRQFWLGLSFAVLLPSTASAAVSIEAHEAASSLPLGGAKVAITVGSNVFSAVTGASGRCVVETKLALGARIDLQKEGFCPMRWEITARDLGKSDFVFALPRSITIGGSVVDESGAPVPGARIEINFPQRLSGACIPSEDLAPTSDQAGRWQASFVPGGTTLVHVDVTETNHTWMQSPPDLETLRRQKAVFRMTTLFQLRGRVLDPSGHPVAGALAWISTERN